MTENKLKKNTNQAKTVNKPICIREGCGQWAKGDEFCSANCCRIHYGLITLTEIRRERKERQKVAYKGYVYSFNEHQSYERYKGPTVGKGKARGSVG